MDEGPKLLGLVGLLQNYHDELEYDLLTIPGAPPLADFWRGRMSWRLLRVLVKQLPPTGAVMRALDVSAQWGVTDHLLAAVLEQLHRLGGSSYEVARPGKKTAEQNEQDIRARQRERFDERERRRAQQLEEGAGDDG